MVGDGGWSCRRALMQHVGDCVRLSCRVGFVGVYAASMVTGRGPVKLLLEHISDPVHNNATTVVQNLLQ